MDYSLKDRPTDDNWLSELTAELERKRQSYEDSFTGFNAYLHWLNTLDYYVTNLEISGRGVGWLRRLPRALRKPVYRYKMKKCSGQISDEEALCCFVREFIQTPEDRRIVKSLISKLRNRAGVELLERWKNEPEPEPAALDKWEEVEQVFGVDVPASG